MSKVPKGGQIVGIEFMLDMGRVKLVGIRLAHRVAEYSTDPKALKLAAEFLETAKKVEPPPEHWLEDLATMLNEHP